MLEYFENRPNATTLELIDRLLPSEEPEEPQPQLQPTDGDGDGDGDGEVVAADEEVVPAVAKRGRSRTSDEPAVEKRITQPHRGKYLLLLLHLDIAWY